jgi:hypothetical protein
MKNSSAVCFSYKLPKKKWKIIKIVKGADGSGLLEEFLKSSKAIWFILSEFFIGADLGNWKNPFLKYQLISLPLINETLKIKALNLSFNAHGNRPR